MKITIKQLRRVIKEEISNFLRSKTKKSTKKVAPRISSAWKNPTSGGTYLNTNFGGFYYTPYNHLLTPVEPKDIPKNLDSWMELKGKSLTDMKINVEKALDLRPEDLQLQIDKERNEIEKATSTSTVDDIVDDSYPDL